MTHTLSEDARAVLLPAFDGLTLSDTVARFLDEGGVSILLGESRSEYVSRQMSDARRALETVDQFLALTDAARQRSGLLLTAVDQEIGGICRLHDLVPRFPGLDVLHAMSPAENKALCQLVAQAARALGINVFLSPVLDVLNGPNPWLAGRTLSSDPDVAASLAAAYIEGVQAGGVAATGKHFPGFRSTTGDPAVDAAAVSPTDLASLQAGLAPFHAAIRAKVEMMMVGPCPVTALDADRAALRSAIVVGKLRNEMAFQGIIMADDLDSAATMRGDSVATVAIEALNAGCDYLLLADQGTQISEIADAIAVAASTGAISAEALALSANRVRSLAGRFACAPQSSNIRQDTAG
jgi:beta-N-acetylhexosaminidase